MGSLALSMAGSAPQSPCPEVGQAEGREKESMNQVCEGIGKR